MTQTASIQPGVVDGPRDLGGHQEDARADDRADDEVDGVEEREVPAELRHRVTLLQLSSAGTCEYSIPPKKERPPDRRRPVRKVGRVDRARSSVSVERGSRARRGASRDRRCAARTRRGTGATGGDRRNRRHGRDRRARRCWNFHRSGTEVADADPSVFALGDCDRQRLRRAVAHEVELDRVALFLAPDRAHEVAPARRDLLAVGGRHDVARPAGRPWPPANPSRPCRRRRRPPSGRRSGSAAPASSREDGRRCSRRLRANASSGKLRRGRRGRRTSRSVLARHEDAVVVDDDLLLGRDDDDLLLLLDFFCPSWSSGSGGAARRHAGRGGSDEQDREQNGFQTHVILRVARGDGRRAGKVTAWSPSGPSSSAPPSSGRRGGGGGARGRPSCPGSRRCGRPCRRRCGRGSRSPAPRRARSGCGGSPPIGGPGGAAVPGAEHALLPGGRVERLRLSAGSIRSACTLARPRPWWPAVQVAPPSVLLKIPSPCVPT